MSRIEDDHQAHRAQERVALEKRMQEQRAKERAQGDSAFSKLVQQQQAQKSQAQQQKAQTQAENRHLHEEVRASHEDLVADEQELARKDLARRDLARGAARFTEKLTQGRSVDGQRALAGRAQDQQAAEGAALGRGADARSGAATADSRNADRAVTDERLKERSSDGAGGGQEAAPENPDVGDLRAGRDGGQGNGGKDQKGGKEGEAPAGFRFNPALMAPVPVALPKDSSGSARLRALANEIAQKIVERARVGKNAAGVAEFQIDLRSNVLSGLSIKVSGSSGKIRAVFSGSDRQVLKLLREQAEGLKNALTGRGLTLEEFRIEERA